MTDYEQQKYYRSHGHESEKRKYKQSTSRQNKGRQLSGRHNDPSLSEDRFEFTESYQEMKAQNQKLKKALKQSTAKRSLLVKECSSNQKHIEELENQIEKMKHRMDQDQIDKEGDRYRVEELRFLNKQLASEINQLREENQSLMERVRYCSEVVQKKYKDLQEKTMKRIEQSLKRVKKSIHYLETLSIKDIEKTKEILIENLKKSTELLKGKYVEDNNTEQEIQELMDPLRKLQEEISQKSKQVNNLRAENKKLQQQVKKHKRIENELLPQYKQSIQGLKKNLAQVRSQLSQNEIQKAQIKRRYEQKVRGVEQKHQQLLIEYRKNKLQKKLFENKLQQLEEEKQEEKERLVGENQMLKKLYEMKKRGEYNVKEKEDLQLQRFNDSQEEEHSEFSQNRAVMDYDRSPSHKSNQKHPNRKDQFKKRKPQHSAFNEEQNMIQGYTSADYYNNHKTTKNTYGDEPLWQGKKIYQKNLSSKDLHKREITKFVQGSNSRTKINDNKKSSQHLSVSRSRHNPRQQPHQQSSYNKPSYKKDLDERSYTLTNQHQQSQSQEEEQEYQFADENEESYQPEEQTSIMSQASLKNEICRIDQEIMEIQKNLTKQLQAYK